MRPCPKCGKPMVEAPDWKGYWRCPDYVTAINDQPPFRFLCTGSDLTAEGVITFERAARRIIAAKN